VDIIKEITSPKAVLAFIYSKAKIKIAFIDNWYSFDTFLVIVRKKFPQKQNSPLLTLSLA
jgi:hypothetical protein